MDLLYILVFMQTLSNIVKTFYCNDDRITNYERFDIRISLIRI